MDPTIFRMTTINNHKLLCGLTLGLAIVVYAIGNLAGRAVSWVKECCGTAKKTGSVARENLNKEVISSKTVTPKNISTTSLVNPRAPSVSLSEIQEEIPAELLPVPSSVFQEAGSIKAVFLSKSDSVKKSFAAFIVELEKEIFPLYEKHEMGFDKHRIHGRMHIARAIIFSEVMARYYDNRGESVDFDYVRRTTGLHDAGRKGNGVDLWEQESCGLLYQHLISKNIPKKEAKQKSTIILKALADKNSIEFKIFQSADCLDIMRPCTGNGGKAGFNPKYLTFLANTKSDVSQLRQSLIEEAWLFIEITERQKMAEFNESEGFMEKLFQIIRTHQDRLPILSSIL